MKKSKFVESWWVELLPNGIYHLLINTTDRWMEYHAYCDTLYVFGSLDNLTPEEHYEQMLELPKFLPDDGKIYLPAVLQEKDQISWFFIPFEKGKREKNILFESKNY